MESFFEITDSWTTSPSKELIKKTFAGHNMIVVGPPLKFVMVLAPGHAHQLTIKFHLTLTVFWLRSCLNRDTAPVLAPNFVTGDKFAAPIKLCTATAPELNKICTRTAKTAPYPPCTVTVLWLMYQDDRTLPGCCRRVTLTKPYRRAVIGHLPYQSDNQSNP